MHATKLRELLLRVAPEPDRQRHLSAASGLARVRRSLYVVADDELHLGVFPFDGDSPGQLVRLIDGELPDSKAQRKDAKPDFEVLTLLPQSAGRAHGALLILGSGSRRQRRRGVLVALDERGATVAAPRVFDASNLYEAAEKEVHDVNIEGAAIIDDRLILLHRGNKGDATNATIEFRLTSILRSIEDDDAVGKVRLQTVRSYDLGSICDVPLCFTDGAALAGGALVFSAVAENTPDSYQDGPCIGAAIGMIGADGRLQVVHYLDAPLKVEGIHAELDADNVRLWLVTDADDADVPAALYSASVRMPGRGD